MYGKQTPKFILVIGPRDTEEQWGWDGVGGL